MTKKTRKVTSKMRQLIGIMSLSIVISVATTGCTQIGTPDDTPVIAAAKEAACNNRQIAAGHLGTLTGSIEHINMDTCKSQMGDTKYTYSVSYKGDNSAEVIIFLDGKQDEHVSVAKDNTGEWHPTDPPS